MNSAAEVSSPRRDTQSFRRRLIGLIAVGEVGVLAAMALLIAFFWLLEPAFLSERNIRAILNV
ncbi:MAG: ABC transporter permease, partial [Mesorhizobium sp.]